MFKLHNKKKERYFNNLSVYLFIFHIVKKNQLKREKRENCYILYIISIFLFMHY